MDNCYLNVIKIFDMSYKKNAIIPFLILNILLMNSCLHVKDIAYFQKVKTNSNPEKNKGNTEFNYDARIKPKDLLSISVVSSDPEASRIYNLIVPEVSDPTVLKSSLLSQPSLQSYLVDNRGNINFPVFGKIKVAGLSSQQLEEFLKKELAPAFSKEIPIVTIRIINYTVNVLGEVYKPGKYQTSNDRLTIFDGLALAGDMTIYGRRNNVKVLREQADGTKNYYTLDLNDRDVIYSPAYYLEQNDVVYIEPNSSRVRSSNFGGAESFGISALSVLFSLTSLIFTVFKR